jgi:glyoxylase-like metal-dependent hydrolase (beta-lactamase superfamily II)
MRNVVFDRAGLRVFERGWLSSNNVLLVGSDARDSVLVDSGYCTHAPQTLALVAQALDGQRLARVVNTHLHSDHCGANHALQLAFGCDVDIPAGEAAKVDAWDEDALTYRATGQPCPRFVRRGLLADGDTVQLGAWPWQVIATPGHDPHSVALYQPELEVLISADALWENGFGVVFPELEGIGAFDDVATTLARLATLSVGWVIPGHGAAFHDFDAALARAHRRLDTFRADPTRHARHAAKVLIKFHAMDVQRQALPELMQWVRSVPYLRATHTTHFADRDFDRWSLWLIDELCRSAALQIQSGVVCNM